MRAIVQDRYGPPGVLEQRDIPRPAPGDDEVLIGVHAAGVDRGVWHLMTGRPYLVRPAFGVRGPRTPVPGMDLAGVVEAVGTRVTRFAPGDEVFGVGKGAFAQYATAPAGKLTHKPVSLSFVQAGALGISGLTALQALRDHGRVRPGQGILVVGASGGVGTYAVQIAKAHGAEVTGVSSGAKLDLVRSLGADHVIDYQRDDFADGARRYDVIIDIGGNSTLTRLRRALTPTGTLVIVGGEGGGRWLGGLDRQLRAMLLSPFSAQKLTTFVSRENAEDLTELADLVDSGQVTPVIDRVFALDETADAIGHLEAGHARGKVVVTPLRP
jgi:NADPH:quinone reductase-like Zn-dependent oxidoreductase